MANLKAGIVGLPNVGKSTLFNILTNAGVPAQNYPFCTIDPNVGVVRVMDKRLDKITEIVNPEQTINAVVEFVDIAGLVKGAHKGEGLGNQFLANIREVSVVVHVVRYFDDPNVTHVDKKIDPLSDIETIELELILKDLETVNGAVEKTRKLARTNQDEAKWLHTLEGLQAHLEKQLFARDFDWPEKLVDKRKALSLLSDKQVIYLVNSNRELPEDIKEFFRDKVYLVIDLKQEEELSLLTDEEKEEYISELGIEQTGLDRLISMVYDELGMISYFTAGQKEVRAWTVKKDASAPEAAGVIHTDFEKNFIAADVVAFKDFEEYRGWEGAREEGKVRLEGRDYIVKNGDIMLFKHGA